MAIITAGGVGLPAPVSINCNNELIWSSNTGRTADGYMRGSLVAEKLNLTINWGILTATQSQTILSALSGATVSVTINILGISGKSFYRGSVTREPLMTLTDGVTYFKSMTTNLIER